MTKKECSVQIHGFSPAEVFEAGTFVECVPKIKGFLLETGADVDRFQEGLAVRIGLVVAGKSFKIDGEVAEFIETERVLIEGSSRSAGSASVWLDLSPYKKGGTHIDYGIAIEPSMLTRAFESKIDSHLDTTMPIFAAAYEKNVIDFLSGTSQAAA